METLIAGLAEKGAEKAAETGAELLINGIPAALSAQGTETGRGETVSGRVYPLSAQRRKMLQSGQDDSDRTRPASFWEKSWTVSGRVTIPVSSLRTSDARPGA